MKTAFDKFFDPDDNGTHWDTWKAAWKSGYEAGKSEAAPEQGPVPTGIDTTETEWVLKSDAAAQIADQKRLNEICIQDNDRLTKAVRQYEKQIAKLEQQIRQNNELINKWMLEGAARQAREGKVGAKK